NHWPLATRFLLNYPGIVAGEKFFELAAAFFGHDILDLLVEKIVVGGALHAPVHSDAFRKARIDHPAEQVCQARLFGFFIVNEQVINRDTAAQSDYLRIKAVQANAFVAVLAEDQRLAMLQVQGAVRFNTLIGGVFENAVVENLAVLINLDESGALVSGGAFQG